MNKSDSCIVSATPRHAVDESNSGGLQIFERLFDILDLHRDVMNTFTALCHEFRNRRFRSDRLQKLDSTLTDVQHRDANALLIDLIIPADAQSNRSLINFESLAERLHRNADVIDFHLNLKLRMISSTTE